MIQDSVKSKNYEDFIVSEIFSKNSFMKINFVAENQGAFRKSLSIFANTLEGPYIITISGFAVK